MGVVSVVVDMGVWVYMWMYGRVYGCGCDREVVGMRTGEVAFRCGQVGLTAACARPLPSPQRLAE